MGSSREVYKCTNYSDVTPDPCRRAQPFGCENAMMSLIKENVKAQSVSFSNIAVYGTTGGSPSISHFIDGFYTCLVLCFCTSSKRNFHSERLPPPMEAEDKG